MTEIKHFTKEQINVLFPQIATQMYLTGIDAESLPFIVHTVYPSVDSDFIGTVAQNEVYSEMEAILITEDLWLNTGCDEAFGSPEEVLNALNEKDCLTDKTMDVINNSEEITDFIAFMIETYDSIENALAVENCVRILDAPFIKLTLKTDLSFTHYHN